eukprot:TRINITY_DN4519_c0_g1_i3.p1 TRINITY_DN4519_c0_g1~~TRINITY_DN4519_c0_g1_i3.p1  ORF type:complete len:539 (-),score=108.46 TRINITY_DN4519_c0_g1_i3:94-1710(-)
MIRRPPRSTQGVSSAASDVYKRQVSTQSTWKEADISNQKRGVYILEQLKEFTENTMMEKDEMERAASLFCDLLESKRNSHRHLKLIMGFLISIPSSAVLTLTDLRRHLENEAVQHNINYTLLRNLNEQIRQQCTVNSDYFSLYDVPDVIIKQRFGTKEYNLAIGFLSKVKKLYLASKKQQGIANPQITQDDMIPNEMLEDVLSMMKYKHEQNAENINKIIFNIESEIEEKKTKLDVSNDRTVKTIESNIFLQYINSYLHGVLTDYNLILYIIKQIYKWISNPRFVFRTADFLSKFKSYMAIPKTDPDFVRQNAIEIDLFNQRKRISDTESSTSAISSLATRHNARAPEAPAPIQVDDDLADAIDVLNQPKSPGKHPTPKLQKTIPEKLPNFAQEGILSIRTEEDKKNSIEEYDKKIYQEPKGGAFNPKDRFGTLEKDYTEYDPQSTKYEAVNPTDFYLKKINEQSPEKNSKWFLRPHHLETLTRHPYSKVDDILNTKYYSYYPVSYTHLRAHETSLHLVCRLLLEKKKKKKTQTSLPS